MVPPVAPPPMGPPPTAHGRPGIAAYPSAATAYPSGAAGEPDQPLAEKFFQLPMGAAPGAGGQPQADPDQIPRPTPDELADPLRMEVRGDLDANEVMVHPKFIRLSVSSMPQSTSTKTKAALPIGAVIQPLANPPEMPVPLVNFGQTGVVRCRRCRTYVNAYVKFIDGGRRWRCNVCGLANDVPADYYCDLDPDGRRRDRAERPELHLSSVEFVAAQEYMVRPPQPPVYLFVLEASYASVQSGMLRCVATTLTHTLDRLPGVSEGRTMVGLLTFDTTLHFYNLSGSSPQMLVTPEVDEVFLPMADDLLVNLAEHKEKIATLLDRLPSMFASTQATEAALGPALKAAFQMIQHLGGKVHLFTCTRPTIGEAALKNREGATPSRGKEDPSAQLLQPASDFYKNLAVECSKQQVCIDVWSCAAAYTDLATLGQLAKHTTGSVYHYPHFSDVTMGERLSRELQYSLTREQGWEAVMRVRVSKGLRISAFHGHFFIRGTDLLALPNIDEDKVFAIEIAHEENALTASTCCLQAALLYTTSSGERRIRVHTVQLPVEARLNELYEAADVDACVNLLGRQAVDEAMAKGLQAGLEKLQNNCTEMLRAYRSLCPPHAKSTSMLLLPDTLKLLPLYTLGLMKSALFANSGEVKADERSTLMYAYSCAPVCHSTAMMHPRLVQAFPPYYPLPPSELPRLLPLTAASLSTSGAYLLEDGVSITLWIGKGVPTDFLQQAFGWPSLEGVDASTLRVLPAESTQLAGAVHALCELLGQHRSGGWVPLKIVKQGEGDGGFLRGLVEDQTRQMMAYAEFLAHCHRFVLNSKVS